MFRIFILIFSFVLSLSANIYDFVHIVSGDVGIFFENGIQIYVYSDTAVLKVTASDESFHSLTFNATLSAGHYSFPAGYYYHYLYNSDGPPIYEQYTYDGTALDYIHSHISSRNVIVDWGYYKDKQPNLDKFAANGRVPQLLRYYIFDVDQPIAWAIYLPSDQFSCPSHMHLSNQTHECACDNGFTYKNGQCVVDCSVFSANNVPDPPSSNWVTYLNIFQTANECYQHAKSDIYPFDDIKFYSSKDDRGCSYTVCYIDQTTFNQDINADIPSNFKVVSFNNNSDNNNTDNNNSDNNNTYNNNSDNNISNFAVKYIDNDKNISVNIDKSLGIVASVFETKFNKLTRSNAQGFNSLHSSINSMNDNLGSKLDTINNTLNASDFTGNLSFTNFTDFYNNLMTDLNTAEQSYTILKNTFSNGFYSPQISSGVSPVWTLNFHGHSIKISLCSTFSVYKPFITFFMMISFYILSIMIFWKGIKL